MIMCLCFSGVTHENFDGCIEFVYLASILKDLNDNVFAKGVVEGCPDVSNLFIFVKRWFC